MLLLRGRKVRAKTSSQRSGEEWIFSPLILLCLQCKRHQRPTPKLDPAPPPPPPPLERPPTPCTLGRAKTARCGVDLLSFILLVLVLPKLAASCRPTLAALMPVPRAAIPTACLGRRNRAPLSSAALSFPRPTPTPTPTAATRLTSLLLSKPGFGRDILTGREGATKAAGGAGLGRAIAFVRVPAKTVRPSGPFRRLDRSRRSFSVRLA